MAKSTRSPLANRIILRNYVAKHSRNKAGAGAHKDKTKYTRKEKHRAKEGFSLCCASCLKHFLVFQLRYHEKDF